MTTPLIGLCGARGVGKDTFAKMLGYRRIAFADPLRELALACDPLIGEQCDTGHLSDTVSLLGWDTAKRDPDVRRFLQDLGLGVREVLGANTWVEAAFRQYDPAVPTVITDVRFENEIWRIRDHGGILVRLDRSGFEPGDPHISENEWRKVDPDEQYTFPEGGFGLMQAVATSLDRRLRGAF